VCAFDVYTVVARSSDAEEIGRALEEFVGPRDE
jgi:hypothetical protein